MRVDIRPAARFEVLMLNLFGLAQDGKTNARGLPNLPQLALVAREFSDVIRFTRPPPILQGLFDWRIESPRLWRMWMPMVRS